MRRPRHALGTFLVAAALGAAALPATAEHVPLGKGTLLRVQSEDIGPAAAAAAARSATGGRVLGVSPGGSSKRAVYRVKVLLPGGRVRTVTVDASSGQVQR